MPHILDFNLLRQIIETPGAPGREHPIRELIRSVVEPLADTVSIDALGNLHVFRKGSAPDGQRKSVLVAAHMDAISLMIKFIDKKGFATFQPLGGFDPKTLIGVRVLAHGRGGSVPGVIATKPIHLAKPKDLEKKLELTDLVIDFGLPYEKLAQRIAAGDVCTRFQETIWLGDCINGKSLDNRISVYVLVQTLQTLAGHSIPYDLHAVFTVQEEIGLRGAQVAAHALNPDFGFGLDTTIAYDLPEALDHEHCTRLGAGVAIKFYDSSVVTDIRMVRFMQGRAEALGLAWQPEILAAGGTDTGALQRFSKHGTIVGCISIPTRHIHTTVETVHPEDVAAAIDLLSACIQQLDTFDATWV
jgi:endoglucanase